MWNLDDDDHDDENENGALCSVIYDMPVSLPTLRSNSDCDWH